jgi:hypothetical protein
MTFGRRLQVFRVAVGLLVLFLFALVSDLPLPGLVRDWQDREARGTVDEVTAYERRFAVVRSELPARGTVGYRAQLRKRGDEVIFTYRAGGALVDLPVYESFWLAQYAVAPVIVDSAGEHPLIIANFRDEVRLLRSEGR